MNSTVSGKTLGHLNPIVIGMNIFDLRVNSSAIGNDCVNQLDFGSGIRSHCIWGGGCYFWRSGTGWSYRMSRALNHSQKIWEASYIAFLLKQARDMRADLILTVLMVVTNGQSFCKKALERYKQHWKTAFMIYISIYWDKFPEKAKKIFKYMHNIRFYANRQAHLGCGKFYY